MRNKSYLPLIIMLCRIIKKTKHFLSFLFNFYKMHHSLGLCAESLSNTQICFNERQKERRLYQRTKVRLIDKHEILIRTFTKRQCWKSKHYAIKTSLKKIIKQSGHKKTLQLYLYLYHILYRTKKQKKKILSTSTLKHICMNELEIG